MEADDDDDDDTHRTVLGDGKHTNFPKCVGPNNSSSLHLHVSFSSYFLVQYNKLIKRYQNELKNRPQLNK